MKKIEEYLELALSFVKGHLSSMEKYSIVESAIQHAKEALTEYEEWKKK